MISEHGYFAASQRPSSHIICRGRSVPTRVFFRKRVGRVLAALAALAGLIGLLASDASAKSRSDELLAASPVVLSYAWPAKKGTHSLHEISMRSVNVIDMPAGDPHRSPNVQAYWAARGKILLNRVNPFKRLMTASEMYSYFSDSIKSAAGISVDEVVAQNLKPAQMQLLAATLRKLRMHFPDKFIFVWDASMWTKDNAFLLRTIRDYCDMLMLEVYISQSAAARSGFDAFLARLKNVEKFAPGIGSKTIIGIGAYPAMRNLPKSAFSAHLEKQIRYLSEQPVLRALPGLAIYSPFYLSTAEQLALDHTLMEQKAVASRVSREALSNGAKPATAAP